MSEKIQKNGRGPALIIYYVVILITAIGSFFPELRLWGFKWWAYFHPAAQMILLAFALVAPMLLRTLSISDNKAVLQLSEESAPRAFVSLAVILSLIVTAAFVLLRVQTFFLGDGYQILSGMTAAQPFVKTVELGETKVHLILIAILGGADQINVLNAYRILSIGSGLLFLICLSFFAAKTFDNNFSRLLGFVIVAFGGYALLFFGYIEHYSIMLAMASILLMLGILVAQRKLNKYWIVLPAIIAPLLHMIAIVFWPAVIYLLVRDTGIGRMIGNWPTSRKLTAAILIGAGTIAAFVFIYFKSSFFFRLVFLPLTAGPYTPEGYTLLSFHHLLDIVNLLIVLVPALPLFVWLAIDKRGAQLYRPEYKFLGLAILGSFAAIFMLDPKIGMPRDADLFSIVGVPLALAGALLLLTNLQKDRARIYVAILATLLTLLISVPREAAWSSESIGLAHFKSYLIYDKLKNRAGRQLLVNYYRDHGDEKAAEAETRRWQEEFPAVSLAARATEMSAQGNYREAIALNHEAIKNDPIFWVSFYNLGSCFNAIHQYDSAIYYFEICDGLNPNNSQLLNNLGFAYSQTGQLDKAIEKFERCFEIDSTAVAALVNLMDIKKNAGDNDAFYRYLQIGLKKFPNSPQVMQQLGDYLVIRQQFDKARIAYDSAMTLGLSPAYVEKIKKLFPQLYPNDVDDSTRSDRQ